MGQLTLPSSGNVYVDTNAVIYRVDQIEPYLTASATLWDAVDAGLASVVTSELTFLLGTVGFTCLPITRSILESAG
jgi:hypothetical protein